MKEKRSLQEILRRLESCYGRGEWWPSGQFPDRRWEVCAGAVLAQNTNWKNVEKALDRMKEENIVTHADVLCSSIKKLENAIRPSGFYRQKARRLKDIAKFVDSSGGMDTFSKNVSREQLLSINGVGNETADSILLYALGRQEFVADAYTRRIFSRVGMVSEDATYAEMKGFFEKSSPPDLYGEMHAWIVELAKAHCRKTPVCEGCPLRDVCDTGKQY